MTNINISLPDDMDAFVTAQMAEEGYSSASEYLLKLVREAEKRKAKAALDALLLEGLKNPLNPADIDWTEIEREALEGLNGESIRP